MKGVEPGRLPVPRALAGAALLTPAVVATCAAWSGAGPGCAPLTRPAALPAEIRESSGVVVSRDHRGVLWTMNDGPEGMLHAVDSAGGRIGTVLVDVPAVDWEDLSLARCGPSDCIWIADTGNNDADREVVTLYRVPEPPPTTGVIVEDVTAFPVRFPAGARDVEALFVLPGERPFLVSKGSHAPPVVYRYPLPLRPGTVVTLEVVQRLDDRIRPILRRITGAGLSPDGGTVAIRTYQTLDFMRVGEGGVLEPLDDGRVDLRTLRESQGEGVALGPDGRVVLTSEAGPLGLRGSLVLLRCEPPYAGAVGG